MLTELDLDECRRLLEQHHFGRLAFPDHVGELPMILPVNHLFSEGVVVRTSEGSKLRAAGDNVGAAFEIDGIDERDRTGWSVVVQGPIEEVTDAAELAELSATPLTTWAPGERPTTSGHPAAAERDHRSSDQHRPPAPRPGEGDRLPEPGERPQRTSIDLTWHREARACAAVRSLAELEGSADTDPTHG